MFRCLEEAGPPIYMLNNLTRLCHCSSFIVDRAINSMSSSNGDIGKYWDLILCGMIERKIHTYVIPTVPFPIQQFRDKVVLHFVRLHFRLRRTDVIPSRYSGG